MTSRSLLAPLLVALLGASFSAAAQEAAIRKNLAERLPNLPKIEEINKSPIPGLYEVRVNRSDFFYTDAEGNYLIQGELIDTKTRSNLTEQRMEKFSAIPFHELPSRDAFTIVRGNGKRQLAIFEDPNCGYCKRFEKGLSDISDVTIHVYLYPILGQDSVNKSKNIWCAKDKGKAFLDWMLRNVTPPAAAAGCDASALQRNVAFGQKNRINGTPTTFLADGTRLTGAVETERIEQALNGKK